MKCPWCNKEFNRADRLLHDTWFHLGREMRAAAQDAYDKFKERSILNENHEELQKELLSWQRAIGFNINQRNISDDTITDKNVDDDDEDDNNKSSEQYLEIYLETDIDTDTDNDNDDNSTIADLYFDFEDLPNDSKDKITITMKN